MPPEETPERWDKGRVEAFSDGVIAIAITLLVRAGVQYADSQPHLTTGAQPVAAAGPAGARRWRPWLSAILYGLAILIGIFTFPRVAAAAYLVVAVKGVLVVGGEGRLGL